MGISDGYGHKTGNDVLELVLTSARRYSFLKDINQANFQVIMKVFTIVGSL